MLTILIILAAFLLIGAFVGVVQSSTIEHSVVCVMVAIPALVAMTKLSAPTPQEGLFFGGLDYAFLGVGIIEGVIVAGTVNRTLERRQRRRAEAFSRGKLP